MEFWEYKAVRRKPILPKTSKVYRRLSRSYKCESREKVLKNATDMNDYFGAKKRGFHNQRRQGIPKPHKEVTSKRWR